jgi:hypothetical protein
VILLIILNLKRLILKQKPTITVTKGGGVIIEKIDKFV